MEIEVTARGKHHDGYGSGYNHLRADSWQSAHTEVLSDSTGACRCWYACRLRIPLQPLQICMDFCCALVAQLAVFLQRFADDFFQPRGDFRVHSRERCRLPVKNRIM